MFDATADNQGTIQALAHDLEEHYQDGKESVHIQKVTYSIKFNPTQMASSSPSASILKNEILTPRFFFFFFFESIL